MNETCQLILTTAIHRFWGHFGQPDFRDTIFAWQLLSGTVPNCCANTQNILNQKFSARKLVI